MAGDWTRLRQIMYQPQECWLSTEYSGDRWLTDQYVLLDVTGEDWLRDYRPHVGDEACAGGECNCPDEIPDGPYKLTVSKGPEPREGAAPAPDLEDYFARIAADTWVRVIPSEWSVAEHPGKAMLWSAEGVPKLMGEPTWSQIKRHYPEVEVEASRRLFRFSLTEHIDPYDDCAAGQCGCSPVPFCYAAGIRVPNGQEAIAKMVAGLTWTNRIAYAQKSTSNREDMGDG